MMTITFKCKNCGNTLFTWSYKQNKYAGPPEPSAIISLYGGRCPFCGHPLSAPSIDDISFTLRKGGK